MKKINDVILQFLVTDELDKMGVMPMVTDCVAMRNHIDMLSPEESRKLRRKFRKLWRKLAKERFVNTEVANIMYGLGDENPTPAVMNERRHLVFSVALANAKKRRTQE